MAKNAKAANAPSATTRAPMWRFMAAYFPATLAKTAELDPARNYIFSVHPHGVIAISCWLNFVTDATGFTRLFPGGWVGGWVEGAGGGGGGYLCHCGALRRLVYYAIEAIFSFTRLGGRAMRGGEGVV